MYMYITYIRMYMYITYICMYVYIYNIIYTNLPTSSEVYVFINPSHESLTTVSVEPTSSSTCFMQMVM